MKDPQNLNSNPILLTSSSSFKAPHSNPKYCSRNRHNNLIKILKPAMLLLLLFYLSLTSAQKLSNYKSNINTPTSIVIPHIKYGQGLNRWSFLSVDRSNHGLSTSLLCPNPMLPTTPPKRQSPPTHKPPRKQQQLAPHPISPPLPTEIWAIKTKETKSSLPCSLRQHPPKSPQHHRHSSLPFTENRILLINISLAPFNYYGATPCSKYIKLTNDPQEGTLLRCRDIPYDSSHSTDYQITWPTTSSPNWSLLENLERFLKTEKFFRRQFYFQIYFKSFTGNTKRCTVQQYELDLSYPEGSSRYCNLTSTAGGYDELCGEFNCDELIFPLYADPQEPENKIETFEEEEDYYDRFDEEETHHVLLPKIPMSSDGARVTGDKRDEELPFQWSRIFRLDMKLLVFVTIVPLVLFGVLVFGLELVVYFMCCRKRESEDDNTPPGERSNALLQNSLNVWENVPTSRLDATRTVSFSPMTTSIYGRDGLPQQQQQQHHQQHPQQQHQQYNTGTTERIMNKSNIGIIDSSSIEMLSGGNETPKVLKSAMKHKVVEEFGGGGGGGGKGGYFEYDMPPSYIETTCR